jgi:hypothetical protein
VWWCGDGDRADSPSAVDVDADAAGTGGECEGIEAAAARSFASCWCFFCFFFCFFCFFFCFCFWLWCGFTELG